MKKLVNSIFRCIFSLFYDKKYLHGYFFDVKRMGWYWCFMGLPSRLWGANRKIPWPVNPRTLVSNPTNIEFDINNINVFQTPGCYWQNHKGKIVIGKGTWIAPNVGLITTNHDIKDSGKHVDGQDIILGEKCWVGMNAVILPGVVLGPGTVVGAGAVVTKSFPEGKCVVGGVPAKLIKSIE
ncbi:acyltransferase [Bacteroides pyogenes]|uniref:acyltransferase n=1 Tax=Bacteroides pyogenes TaxID=310300 RepID=UPI002FD8FFB2